MQSRVYHLGWHVDAVQIEKGISCEHPEMMTSRCIMYHPTDLEEQVVGDQDPDPGNIWRLLKVIPNGNIWILLKVILNGNRELGHGS